MSTELYREVQRFRQPWLLLILALGVGLTWFGFFRQIIQGIPFGNNPASDGVMIGATLFVGLAFPVLFLSMGLETRLTPGGLQLRFFPFQRHGRLVTGAEIVSWQTRTYSAIREYGGWGIKYGPSGQAYNISGNQGLQLELQGGKRLLVGTAEPERLALAMTTWRGA